MRHPLWTCVIGLGALLLLVAPVDAQNHCTLGTNVTGPTDWGTEFPFANVFKCSRPWISGTRSVWDDQRALDLDAHGWVRSLQPGQLAKTLVFSVRASAVAPAGQYTVLYDGEGTIEYYGNVTLVSHSPGRDVVNVTARQGGVMVFISSVNPANYLRNVRMMMPGTADGDLFNPVFLDRIHPYRCVRFMPWQFAASSSAVPGTWATRPHLDDARWNISWNNVQGQSPGVPVEVLVALCNRLGVDGWFSLPYTADDDYMARFAQYVSDNLDPRRKAYVEWTDEVWNNRYAQAAYARQQGLALGLSADPWTAQLLYSALRSRQMFGIFEQYLPPSRLVRVLGSFHAVPWVSQLELSFRDTAAHTDALAVAPYWGVLLPDQTQALTWDLNALFNYLQNTMLPGVRNLDARQLSIAQSHGVQLIAYEGGQSLQAYGDQQNNASLNALYDAAERDPRMGALYLRFLQDWSDVGGGIMMHFTNCEGYSVYGRFGSLEYITQPRSAAPKYNALQSWIEGVGAGAAGGPVAPAFTSPAPGTQLSSSSATFTWSAGTGVTRYWLCVGSIAGGQDLFSHDEGSGLSATVNGLPTDGRALYVRLWYLSGSTWRSVDASYRAQ